MKQQNLRFDRYEVYKVFISVLFGLLGFIGTFNSVQFDYGDVNIIINWSLIFPLMVTMAWGKRYGCISIILGLSVLYPFFLGGYNGWACIVPAFSLYIWIMILGYGAEKRFQAKKFYTNTYFLQFIYIMIRLMLYFTVFPFLYRFNPPFWYPDAHTTIAYSTIVVFAFKTIIIEFILLAVCDTLLLLPVIRKIFRLQSPKTARYNTGIVLGITAVGMLFALIIMITNYYIIDGLHSFQWLLHPSAKVLMTLFLAGSFSLIFGSFLARIFQWQLATKENLKVSEAKYRSIFENISDLYTEAAMDGTILTLSPSVKEVLGYEADDLIGTNISNLYDNPAQRIDVIKTILQEKEIKNYEVTFKDKNGYQHCVWVHAKIADHGDGQQKIIGVTRDVTERVKAEEELKRVNANLETIVESTNDLIWLVDRDFRSILCNSAFTNHTKKYFGADIALGIRFSDIFTGDYALVWDSYFGRVLKEGSYSTELLSPASGIYFDISFNPIFKDGEVLAISCFAKNISQRKLAEMEIHTLNAELEQRVVERTAELQMAVSELEAFTFTVSHDLKSPLRAIDAYSRIMLEDYPKQMEGEIGEIAGNIKNISRDMIELINKLLQYSTTSRLDIYKESVEIKEMICMIFHELASALPERKIKLIMETELPRVIADKILLKQVIYNVISNAIKFTKTRDTAVIKVGYTIDKDEVVFYISDNGAGFDMELSGKLFGIFQRLHSTDEYEGTGIGLATVRKIMRKHGGRTWIEGKPDQGATVFFTLPVIEDNDLMN